MGKQNGPPDHLVHVLQLRALGLSDGDICESLGIVRDTLAQYEGKIRDAFGVEDTISARSSGPSSKASCTGLRTWHGMI